MQLNNWLTQNPITNEAGILFTINKEKVFNNITKESIEEAEQTNELPGNKSSD